MRLRVLQAQRMAARLASLPVRPLTAKRRVILHVGPHRTGTTTVQETLRASQSVMPWRVEALTRENRAVARLSGLIHNTQTRREARRKKAAVRRAAENVAALCTARTTIISDEDLIGALPTRRRLRGLYPFLEILFPVVLDAFEKSGAQVTVAWTPRFYPDWLESVFYRRHSAYPSTPFVPRRYRFGNGLPGAWDPFAKRFTEVCANVDLATLSFEEDVKAGIMGQGLFQLAGLSPKEIARLKHAKPQNVSRHRPRAEPKRN
ncbi:MAG: hypothetical protein ACPGVA_05465 [Pikeienuella sp.]